ncbi:MAG TPA: glycine oxidase ThiO [Terriglobales bacterium]|nr:glycine oxidase ThiO [Terriglobales bacterium]
MHTSDVIIAGAGIIGLSLALELRRAGASVTVLDRGEPGREASSAAAGMLVSGDPDLRKPLKDLAVASAQMYRCFVDELELRSGITVGYEARGTLYIAASNDEPGTRPLSLSELSELEPELAEPSRAYFLQEQSVDPRLLSQAAVAAGKRLGVTIHHESRVAAVTLSREHEIEVRTERGLYRTATFANCAGAWAKDILGVSVPTRPVKGQMLTVIPRNCKLRHVIRSSEVYLVPRKDGRVLIGATVEEAGFDKTVNPSSIQGLHQAAAKLVPAIGEAKILEAWAGLRPGSPDNLPILGPGRLPGTYVASGHFRNGILLAPITAVMMSQLIQGKKPQFDLRPFAPSRFAANQALAV